MVRRTTKTTNKKND